MPFKRILFYGSSLAQGSWSEYQTEMSLFEDTPLQLSTGTRNSSSSMKATERASLFRIRLSDTAIIQLKSFA
ncbi:predicted protein [Botrytis cinerea T4]|uniref:Uncharacterized protein n=1 Tax=Botryotinia fuckeliana (strain T4) TaxID=999810 RepID=G2YTN3_BOTF4|nr:predicted protein [Botrytis cinerea T4]